MERYERYKDSGVKWLGEIPSHWEIRRTKYLWKEIDKRSESGSEQLLSVSQYDGVREAQSDSRSESLKGYKIVKPEDLVINIMLAWLGGLGVSKHEGIVSPAYCVYKLLENQNPHFLHYLYRTPLYLAEFARHSTGIVPSRWRMYTDDFGEVLTILPPLEEQNRMVEYLNKTTSKIDEAIAQQQKMIDLLNERKQIIINNAVTKGLDPNVKMKPSGIDWIGDIPEHWVTIQLKRVSKICTGKTPSSSQPKFYEEGTICWFTPGDIKDFELKTSEKKITENAINEGQAKLYPRNSIYFVGIGSIGKVGFFSEEASSNQQINIIIPNKKIVDVKYLTLLASCLKDGFVMNANAALLPIINQQKTGSVHICLPPLTEQQSIIDNIYNKLQPIIFQIEYTNEQISLLQERKQIIINDVVTGKVKVV